jgi:hypothetical protein
MRLLLVALVAAAGIGAARAQGPVIINPPPAAPPPPPLFVPPAVPSVVTPLPAPRYGVPSNIDTSTPIYSSSRVIHRQSLDYKPRNDRVAKRRPGKKPRRHTAN